MDIADQTPDTPSTKVLNSLAEYESMMAGVPTAEQGVNAVMPSVYDPAAVYARHEDFIRLRHLGLTFSQIAEEVDCPLTTVSSALNSEVAKERLANLAEGADEEVRTISSRIVAALEPAMSVLEEILDGDNPLQVTPALRLKTAQDVLDRGGHGKVVKVEGKHIHGVLGEGGLAAVQARVREMELAVARESGAVVGGGGADITENAVAGPSRGDFPSGVPEFPETAGDDTGDLRVSSSTPEKEE